MSETRRAWTVERPPAALYVLVACVATAPAWIVHHPPLEDLPLHLATIRILRSLHDPAFAMDRDLVLELGRTQYVLYGLAGAAVATLTGLATASALLVSAYLGGTVLALRQLLRALGRDERACLLVVPLLVNQMFVYGLLPFLLGIPLMFSGLAASVLHFERLTARTGLILSALTLALFFTHVVPFGVLCIGFAVMFPWRRSQSWIRAASPLALPLIVVVWWALFTEAGRIASGAAGGADPYRGLGVAVADLSNWFVSAFRDGSDGYATIALSGIVGGAVIGSMRDPDHGKDAARMYALLPLACALLYFVLPASHGYVWLIAQRFPLLFAMTAIPLVRIPEGRLGVLVFAAALALGAFVTVNTCWHFLRFEREEVGRFDDAIAAMAPGRRVCALMFDNRSAIVGGAPFLHFGSYYQAEKGGVVMFTFAGYPHWPVDFKAGRYPPPGHRARERWEWTPAQVPINEIFPYYDYVLTRGPGFDPPAGTYHLFWRDVRWSVWERDE